LSDASPKISSKKNGQNKCDLCGLPLGRSTVNEQFDGQTLCFCCNGCLYVFQALYNSPDGKPADFRATELYQACVSAGIIPSGEPVLEELETNKQGPVDEKGAPGPDRADIALELDLQIDGMWCPACSLLLKDAIGKCKGVLNADVHFFSDYAKVKYLPHLISPEEISEKIKGLGYQPVPVSAGSEVSSEKKAIIVRLGISAILTMNIMLISYCLYAGFFNELGGDAISYFSYIAFGLATPVVFYGGASIIKRAWAGIRHLKTSMDTLIAMGALSAYFYSLFQMLKGSLHLYFDTASMLIAIVLLGRYIELHAKEKVTRGLHDLWAITRQKVRRIIDTKERWLSPEAIEPGDRFLVKKGERIPVDGYIVNGRAIIDESFITGESRPVKYSSGANVLAGGLITDGEVMLVATMHGSENSVMQMAKIMQDAMLKKNSVELLADRITGWFVPAIILIAIMTSIILVLSGISHDEAMIRGVTILVITCPCALGIATPVAKVAAIVAARAKGIMIVNPHSIEKASCLDHIFMDKTGTVTEGNFSLREILTTSAFNRDQALALAASIEEKSTHFLAREIIRNAELAGVDQEKCMDHQEIEGLGVRASLGVKPVLIGGLRLMISEGLNISDMFMDTLKSAEEDGLTVVFMAMGMDVKAAFIFGDVIKAGSFTAVKRLNELGVKISLISGDSSGTTRTVAKKLNIALYHGDCYPADKVALIKKAQAEGEKVGMLGDGLNDLAALAQADTGFALGAKSGFIQKASDVTFISDDPSRLLAFISLSSFTMRIIKQNLFFSFFYNVLGIPLAVFGLLNPIAAVTAMFASSLTVISNTLRILKRTKP
jgi:heavy metal translocating P-type ATPase